MTLCPDLDAWAIAQLMSGPVSSEWIKNLLAPVRGFRHLMIAILLYILLGITAASISGLSGIGSGVIIVPALVFLFGLSQHTAQGTTLVPGTTDRNPWHLDLMEARRC